jgi:hypothetical protein
MAIKGRTKMKRYKPYFNEDITIPLEKGQTFLYGKFKNKSAIYDSHYINDKGDLVIKTDTGKEIPACKIRLIQENLNNKILFHGSDNIFTSFNIKKSKRGRAIFLTSSKIDAQSYGKNIYEVQVLKDRLFNYNNNQDFKSLITCVNQQLILEKDKPYNKRIDFYPYTQQQVFEGIKNGKWNFLTQPLIILCLKKLKYNGYIELEGGRISYAFFNPADLKIINKFDENLRIVDLQKHAGASDFTKDWIEIRRKILGTGAKTVKLKSIKINRKKDYITFVFKSIPTYDTIVKAVNFPNTDKDKNVKMYTEQIRILDFFKLAQTKPNYEENQLTRKEIKEILKVADVQVSCDCKSFQFQGMNYILTTFDASIYPELRPPKVWNKWHKDDNFTCKHLDMLLTQGLNIYLNNMTSMINKYLKR